MMAHNLKQKMGWTLQKSVFKKADDHLAEGNIDDDLEDTAEVRDDFDGAAGFQA